MSGPKSSGLALDSAKCPARQSGTTFRQAMRSRCQAVPGAELDCEEDSTQFWMEVLMGCFGSLLMSVTCIGVTRGHSRLQSGCFGSLLECARSWLVRMGSRKLPSSVISDEFGILGTNTDYDSYWETPLGVMDCGHDKIIPTCGLQVVACSRRGEQTLVAARMDQCNH